MKFADYEGGYFRLNLKIGFLTAYHNWLFYDSGKVEKLPGAGSSDPLVHKSHAFIHLEECYII